MRTCSVIWRIFKPSIAWVIHFLLVCALLIVGPSEIVQAQTPRQMEYLDRGLVAVKVANGVYLGWRMLFVAADTYSYGSGPNPDL